MSKSIVRDRHSLPTKRRRWLTVPVGMALLTYLVVRTGPSALWAQVQVVGYGLCVVIALGGLTHFIKTWAWRKTFTCDIKHLSWSRSFGMRLVSEAIGQLGLAGKVVGEGARVSLLGSTVPTANAVATAALDTGFYVVTAVFLTVVAILAGLLTVQLPAGLRVYACVVAGTLTGTLMGVVAAFANGWGLLSPSFRALGHLPGCKAWVLRKQTTVDATEHLLLSFHRKAPRAFWSALTLNLLAHGLALTEIYVILRCLTPRATILGALVLEGLTKLINAIGSLNPGNFGTYEAGNVLITRLFGVSAAAGLTLALCRRARALFWAVIGVICFTVMRRSKGERNTDLKQGSMPSGEGTSMNNYQSTQDYNRNARAVMIIAGEEQSSEGFSPSLAAVGTLPLLLRNILITKSFQPSRIIVCASSRFAQTEWSALLHTRRLPTSVEWKVLHEDLAQLIAEVGATSNGVLLIQANGSYEPKLLHDIFAWDGPGCLALATSGELSGLYVVSQTAATSFSSQVQTPQRLRDWARSAEACEVKEVSANSWHLVTAPDDLVAAERKLDGWLVKSTDGIFARMNRKISIPISRQIIKLPITPNMVTFFVLGVSLASGFFYAHGGYSNILVGALLGLFASILDGCDGEVARIKLQSTQLGCWLDSICDYIYYVVAFGGMALGLARQSGSKTYLLWGMALLCGAVATFLVVSLSRQRLSGSQPEKFLAVWQKKAESRSSNPVMYLARQSEFVLRRCFLPYALLVFAVANLTNVAFMMAAVGANVAWLIALYSYFDFSRLSHVAGKSAAVISPEPTA